MTLIGAWADHDRALLWADTEWYWRDQSEGKLLGIGGYAMKLAASSHLAAVAYGRGDVNSEIGKFIAVYRQPFDELWIDLPQSLLRSATEKGLLGPDAKPFEESICIVAGYSHRFRRVMAATFNLKANFQPAPIGALGFTMPSVDGWAANFTGPLDVVTVAKEQVRRLNLGKLKHGGGALTMADIRRDGISLSAFDLDGGFDLPALPPLPSMAERFPPFNEVGA